MHFNDCGKLMHQLMTELFPICRSITGNGVRETLRIIQRHILLRHMKFPLAQKSLIGPFLGNGIYETRISLTRMGQKSSTLSSAICISSGTPSRLINMSILLNCRNTCIPWRSNRTRYHLSRLAMKSVGGSVLPIIRESSLKKASTACLSIAT